MHTHHQLTHSLTHPRAPDEHLGTKRLLLDIYADELSDVDRNTHIDLNILSVRCPAMCGLLRNGSHESL